MCGFGPCRCRIESGVWIKATRLSHPWGAAGWPSEIPLTLMSFPGEFCLIKGLHWNLLQLCLCCSLCSTGRTTCAASTGCSDTPPTQNWLYWLEITTSVSIMSKSTLYCLYCSTFSLGHWLISCLWRISQRVTIKSGFCFLLDLRIKCYSLPQLQKYLITDVYSCFSLTREEKTIIHCQKMSIKASYYYTSEQANKKQQKDFVHTA